MTSILHDLHPYHIEHAGAEWLDVDKMAITPQPCATYDEMLARYPEQRIPVTLDIDKSTWRAKHLEVFRKDGMSEQAAKEEVDSMDHKTFLNRSYICLDGPFRALIQLFRDLSPSNRNFSTLIIPNQPTHFYAQLYGELAWCLPGAERCRAEFIAEFCAYFRRCFQRDPDLSGMHWERALHSTKLLVHVHITTEAFATHADMKEFNRGFQEHLLGRPAAVMASSHLCRGRDEQLIDSSVYYIHSVLHLNGNCRIDNLHGSMLEHWPLSSDEPRLRDVDLLWRGLPNFALPGGSYGYLVWRPAGGDPEEQAARKWLEPLLVEFLGPAARIDGEINSEGPGVFEGDLVVQTAWCPRFLSEPPHKEYIHKSSRIRFCADTNNDGIRLQCMDTDCEHYPFTLHGISECVSSV